MNSWGTLTLTLGNCICRPIPIVKIEMTTVLVSRNCKADEMRQEEICVELETNFQEAANVSVRL